MLAMRDIKSERFTRKWFPMPQTAPIFLLSLLSATAFAAMQFDASRVETLSVMNGEAAAWRSVDGAIELAPSHPATNGWSRPVVRDGLLAFADDGGLPSAPFAFPSSVTSLVGRVFIVATCPDPVPLSTLLDAPCGLRVAIRPFSFDPWRLETETLLLSASVSIGGANANGLRLFELVPDAACPANALYLGGHPATPNWNRHWRGSVAEAIFLSPSVSAFDAATVAAHLAFKWQLPRTAPPPSDTPFVLRSLGISGDNLYRTLFIFR